MKKILSVFVLSFALAALSCLPAFAVMSNEGEAPAAALAEVMDPEVMMAAAKELASPGPGHEILRPLAGEWAYTARFWTAPDAAPEETSGTSSQALIYGGRFIQQEVKGMWMGQEFEGTGILGYDNIREEYVSIWFDNMATGVMSIHGQYDPETKTVNLAGEFSCPMTGETHRKARAEYVLSGENSNIYRSYMMAPDGKEFLMMEINYTRA